MRKSLFFGVLFCLFTNAAFAAIPAVNNADYLDLSKLNEEQRAQLALQAAQMVKPNVPKATEVADVSEKMREETSKWAELGKNAVVALIAAAKELGVAANEFIGTPVGKMVMVIILWKLVGVQLLGIFFGTCLIIAGTIVARMVWIRLSTDAVEYENIPRLNGLWVTRKIKNLRSTSGEGMFGAWVGTIAPLVISWGIGLMLILH